MAENDLIVLDSIIQGYKDKQAENLTDSDVFEIYTFEQILKNYDLSYEQILSGKVGGGDDGGIDGFYIFVNDELIEEDTELEQFHRRQPLIDIYIIQSTRSTSFQANVIGKIIPTSKELFDLSKDVDNFEENYNNSLIAGIRTFRDTYIELSKFHPILNIFIHYATRGNTDNIARNVEGRAVTLEETISNYIRSANIEIFFIGAGELLDLSRIQKTFTLQLQFIEGLITRGEDNYIGLATLTEFYNFITDERGFLRRYIFESNVRDYQGENEVNRDIISSLRAEPYLDFWWLNNGITILASKATVSGKRITLDDSQIVNGLQTAFMIHKYLRDKHAAEGDVDDQRAILIRIIVSENPEARDRIIKATNFQTRIPDASLRATDHIQRNVEDFFLANGYYYDRRKNYFKNLGMPIDRIISIPYLAQSVMSIVLREPDNARARPSSLIKNPDDYERVFNQEIDLGIYLKCAQIMKRVENYLRNDFRNLPSSVTRNYRFHFAMSIVVKILGRKEYEMQDITNIDLEILDSDLLDTSFQELLLITNKYAQSNNESVDRIVKSRIFVEHLIEEVSV